jgi:hypothetical protein
MTSKEQDEEVHVADREIDAFMKERGYEYDEPNNQYLNGEMVVSGDFASQMTKLNKQSAARDERIKQEAKLEELRMLKRKNDFAREFVSVRKYIRERFNQLLGADCESCEGDTCGVNEQTPCPDCNGTGKTQLSQSKNETNGDHIGGAK